MRICYDSVVHHNERDGGDGKSGLEIRQSGDLPTFCQAGSESPSRHGRRLTREKKKTCCQTLQVS